MLVHVDAVGLDELEELIVDAWRCKAPKRIFQAYERSLDPDST